MENWQTEMLVKAAGIVSGLSHANLAKLNLNSMDAASAIGHNGYWISTKVIHGPATLNCNCGSSYIFIKLSFGRPLLKQADTILAM